MITVISQILGFIGSLCLLLFGMEMLSNGIQKGAGSSLQVCKVISDMEGKGEGFQNK